MIQQRVQQLLAEWREAERELAQTSDPAGQDDLSSRIRQLRDAYHEATAAVEVADQPQGEARMA